MRVVRAFALAFAVGLAACADKPVDDPAAVVTPLYDRYLADQQRPLELLEAAPWTNELRGLLSRALDLSAQRDEPNDVVDFDPIIGAQDWQITDLNVSLDSPPADGRAVVIVRFKNVGQPVELTYAMLKEEGAWRVDDIRGPDWSLRAMCDELGLKPNASGAGAK